VLKAARTFEAAQAPGKSDTTAALMLDATKRAALAAEKSTARAEQLTAQLAVMTLTTVAQPRPTTNTSQDRLQHSQRGGRRRWLKPTPQNLQRINYAQRSAACEEGQIKGEPASTARGNCGRAHRRATVGQEARHFCAAAKWATSRAYVGRPANSRQNASMTEGPAGRLQRQ
jgi:hypothetical protein